MHKRAIIALIIVIAIVLCIVIFNKENSILLQSQYIRTQGIKVVKTAVEPQIRTFIEQLEAKQDYVSIPNDIGTSEVGETLRGNGTKPQIYMEDNRFYIFYSYKSFGKKYTDVIAGVVEPLLTEMAYQAQADEKFINQLELKLRESKRMRLIYDTRTEALKYVDNKVRISIKHIDIMAFTENTDSFVAQCTTVSAEQKDSVRLFSIRDIEFKGDKVKYMDSLQGGSRAKPTTG